MKSEKCQAPVDAAVPQKLSAKRINFVLAIVYIMRDNQARRLVGTGYADGWSIKFTEVAKGIWLPKHNCVKKTGTRSDGTTATLFEITGDSSFGSINVSKDPSSLAIVPAEGTEILYRE